MDVIHSITLNSDHKLERENVDTVVVNVRFFRKMDSETNGLKEFQVKGIPLYKRDGVLMQVPVSLALPLLNVFLLWKILIVILRNNIMFAKLSHLIRIRLQSNSKRRKPSKMRYRVPVPVQEQLKPQAEIFFKKPR
jgi:hypothetical protein